MKLARQKTAKIPSCTEFRRFSVLLPAKESSFIYLISSICYFCIIMLEYFTASLNSHLTFLFSWRFPLTAKELQFRRDNLMSQIAELKKQISSFPNGHLVCIQNGKYMKMQHVVDGKVTIIPKKQQDLARALAEKKFLEARLQDLCAEQEAIHAFLKHYQRHTSKVAQLLNKPAYRTLLSSSVKPVSQELAEWANEPFETNMTHPEQLRHPCLSGHMVRSKSEVLIAQSLFTHQIPFRYECSLKLGEVTVFPDFTLRHPESGNFFIWEHFGKMDYAPYAQNAFQKMQLYNSFGYVPTINLITTYETKEHPLTTKAIEHVIQQYFL